jgi:hypothetical protein
MCSCSDTWFCLVMSKRRIGGVYFLNSDRLPRLYPLQTQLWLLLPMSSSRCDADQERPVINLLCQRHKFPPRSRHIHYVWYALTFFITSCLNLSDHQVPTVQFIFGTKMRVWDWKVCMLFTKYQPNFSLPSHAINQKVLIFRYLGFDRASGPIACSTFSRTGSMFVYAVAYDWYKGHNGMADGHPNKLMLHPVKDEEVQKRAPRR